MKQHSTSFPEGAVAALDRKISQLEDYYVACFLRGEDKQVLHRIHLELTLLKGALTGEGHSC